MISKRRVKKLLKEKIDNIWLFRGISLVAGILILSALYKMEIIAIAFVNGQPITITEVLKMYNSPGEENILDKLIAEKIIEYEAKKRKIQVTSEEVADEIAKMEKKALENGKTLAELMRDSEQTAKDLEKNTRLRIIVYKILSEDIELSESEIDRFILENPEVYGELSEEEMREEVRQLLIDAQIQNEYDSWIREAKASSKIDYFIKL